MATKKHPWWKPTGRDAYVGIVLFHGENVLLRRMNSKGYKWTFPRRKIREEHVDIEYYNACDFAESLGASLRRVLAIPGTWRGEASVAQYWRADASSFAPPGQMNAVDEAQTAFGEATPTLIEIAGKFVAAGLPLSLCGHALPLSPETASFVIEMAESLPPADPQLPPGDDLEWVPVSAAAHHLAQSESKQGRRRDIAVWHAALAVGQMTKPIGISGLGWNMLTRLAKGGELLSLPAERREDLNAWPFHVPPASIEYNMRAVESLRAATNSGWRLQACFTCRHLKCSGMATEAGGGWCTAAREPDDERRAPIPYSLGWCSTYEAALVSRGGVEARRSGPRTPKEQTWSFAQEQVAHGKGLAPAVLDVEHAPPSEPTPLTHSTFITSRLFSRVRPSYGIRLVPADRPIDQIGPSDRSYVCIGDYDEMRGHSVREIANCLFGIDQPLHSADGYLLRKYAYPEVVHEWPASWRVFLVRLHDDAEVDLFPGTWKSIAFIMQDPDRMFRNPGLHQSFHETHGQHHKHHFYSKKRDVDFLELDADFQWSGSAQAGWYHYCSKNSLLTDQVVREVGVANRCWHGRGYIGTAPDVRGRVFLVRNLAVDHHAVRDLGVLSADEHLPDDAAS